MKLDVTYLLDQAPLFGGVKVVLEQAALLHAAGHRVRVLCTAGRPDWFEIPFDWVQTTELHRPTASAGSVVVATYWTTIEPALRHAAGGAFAVHYCQGFEAAYDHNRDQHAAIREAYSRSLPALVVSPHLRDMLQKEFGRRAEVVTQPLSPSFRPRRSVLPARPGRPSRILVMSPYEITWKGVDTALEALALLRGRGFSFELVRLSQFEQSDEEAAFELGGEFHHHLRPEEVPDLVRSCDLLLAPSHEAEGFGLPVLEALASGVPCLTSDVSCFRSWAGNAVLRVAGSEPRSWADQIERVLGNGREWRDLRRRGLQLAREYSPQQSLASIERAIEALTGEARASRVSS